jgi:hypothetical protein
MPTRLSDIIEPSVFAPYVIERTTELSLLIQSGIITQNEKLNALVAQGGRTINMPFWGRLQGDSEVLSDTTPLTVGKISAQQDIAVMHFRGKPWGANELASAVAGDSAMDAIGTQVAEYWLEEEQKILVATLTGAFAAASMAGHVKNISTETNNTITANSVLDAKQLLGDAANQLAAMFMHSAVYTELQKQNLIVYIPNARGEVVIPTYLTYRVLVDDSLPVADGVFDTYLMANGAIGRGDGIPVDFTPVETDRDSLQGDDILINRRAFVLHPMGVKWVGNSAGVSPSNAELRVGTNWQLVYNPKNVGLVLLRHKI